jgi:hypothetical protein
VGRLEATQATGSTTTNSRYRGIVHTVSDRRAIELEVHSAPMRVLLGDSPPPDIHPLNVGDVVDARMNVTTEQRAGGDEVLTYTSISIERVAQARPTRTTRPGYRSCASPHDAAFWALRATTRDRVERWRARLQPRVHGTFGDVLRAGPPFRA